MATDDDNTGSTGRASLGDESAHLPAATRHRVCRIGDP
jgi:hypothetical protein